MKVQSGERWVQARELFLDLADLPADERQGELEQLEKSDSELASWVRDLLRHDQEGAAGNAASPSRDFGRYEIVRPIGQGGMGEVYVARRADGEYESEVAIKLLRGGITNQELVRRFLRERQMLARLDHEYIARLLDGGTTPTGEPYFVMEYVEGEPADVFAARLELRERIELFIRIGQAVSHAHERGFVHRDLKPNNILVRADGTPRLLDFGIARTDTDTQPEALEEEPLTRTGHRLFTPEYASPEQVRGEVATARSDIFALGVLLYVFLSGQKPWTASASQFALERSICEEDPTPPSRLVTGTARRRVSGDLDAIVMQCLAKRPRRRYASVAELSRDLENHLAGRPIQARRTGTLGRAVRFARRRPAIPIAVALLSSTLLAIGVARDADRRGQRRQTELATSVSDRIIVAKESWADGEREAAEEELDAALAALEELPEERQLQAAVLAQKAVFAKIRREWEASHAFVERARALLDGSDDPDPRVLAILFNVEAQLLFATTAGDASREASRTALEHARANLEQGDAPRIDALLGWADELEYAGRIQEAQKVVGEAIAEVRSVDPKSETISFLLNEQAVYFARMERNEEAVSCYRESLETMAWHRGAGHPGFAKVRLNLGATLYRLGRLKESKEEYEKALVTFREQNDEPFLASNLHFLGKIQGELGFLDVAEEQVREAIAIRERLGMESLAERSRFLLGVVLAKSEQTDEAFSLLEPILERAPSGLVPPALEAEGRALLATILLEVGDPDGARQHLRRALILEQDRLGPGHEDCLALEKRIAELP